MVRLYNAMCRCTALCRFTQLSVELFKGRAHVTKKCHNHENLLYSNHCNCCIVSKHSVKRFPLKSCGCGEKNPWIWEALQTLLRFSYSRALRLCRNNCSSFTPISQKRYHLLTQIIHRLGLYSIHVKLYGIQTDVHLQLPNVYFLLNFTFGWMGGLTVSEVAGWLWDVCQKPRHSYLVDSLLGVFGFTDRLGGPHR